MFTYIMLAFAAYISSTVTILLFIAATIRIAEQRRVKP